MLKFGQGNAKVGKDIATFSLPAGYTCLGANECLAMANKKTGKIKDGPNTQFRCFSATTEAIYSQVRKARWYNLELLKKSKSLQEMITLIQTSLPPAKIVRIHVSGDFFSERYFLAWVEVAKNNPHVIFYAYTKALNLWVRHKNELPSNFRLTASKGGKFDSLIEEHDLTYAQVVFSEDEAAKLNLELDHDDSLAIQNTVSFGLLLHGSQPKGTNAAKAWQSIKQTVGGYS